MQALSNAVLSSAVGVSDGITVQTGRTAPMWNASIVDPDAGLLVTHQGMPLT